MSALVDIESICKTITMITRDKLQVKLLFLTFSQKRLNGTVLFNTFRVNVYKIL